MRGWGIYFDPVVDYIENAAAAAMESARLGSGAGVCMYRN